MARGCDAMADNPEHEHGEYEIPVIQIENGLDAGPNNNIREDEDDDAAVYLQELGLNYGITARSKGRSSVFQSLEVSREGSAVSSEMSSVLSRQKSTRTLVEMTNRVTQGGGDGHLYRLLSAKRNHVQQLNSDVTFLHRRIKELEEQNRLLVRLGKRQEAALCRYQDMKSELPHIIEAHKIEITVLQDKLRRSTEVNRRNNDRLKVTDNRIVKLTEDLSRLRELSRKRHLPERDQLNNKLSSTTQALQEKEKDVEELQRRLAIVEKSLKQQVQAEVGRHRATAKKLYKLQCEHHNLQDTLKDREKELGALQQYSRRAGRTPGGSSTTTATSSRSGSISARRKSGRNRSSGSSGTTTSGIVSAVDVISTSESRMSLPLDASGRLPPISADPRKRTDCQITSIMSISPEPSDVPTRRSRHRGHLPGKMNKDCAEDRRTGRMRRGRRSPRHSTDDDYLLTPRCTPTPSPSTTPEPQIQRQFESNGDGTDTSATLSGNSEQRRRQCIAATLQDASRKSSLEDHRDETGCHGRNENIRPSVTREYSLIENYPPRERIVLTGGSGGSSGGSDSGSGVSPPPVKPAAFVTEGRVPSRLSRIDSPLPSRGQQQRRHNTNTAGDLRTVSSLSELDSHSNPKPTTRAAITP